MPRLEAAVGLRFLPVVFGVALLAPGAASQLATRTGAADEVRAPAADAPGAALAAIASCQPTWVPTFGGQPGVSNAVHALAVFDDGGGPALHAGGDFLAAGGVAAAHVATWNGTSWSALGSGLGGNVYALTVFDDGGGPALYAGGQFTAAGGVPASHVAKWNGTSWSALGSGTNDRILALAVFDDGGGPALYAGGRFTTAGGVAANHVAKWNGSSWSALGGGTNDWVHALTVFDDGGGPALYAGGRFTVAGVAAANRIARWSGASWSALGSGTNDSVLALTVFDDGSGPALCAGGLFTTAGGVAASRIARWSGSSWSALGSGLTGLSTAANALTVFDDGGGPALYAGGFFSAAGGVAANSIAKWDGSSWSPLGSGTIGSVDALAVLDRGAGPELYAGGTFLTSGGVLSKRVAKWNGTRWSKLGNGVDGVVRSLAVFDDGGGPALYAGGGFSTTGGVAANTIAKWNGASWSALGTGMDGSGSVRALTVFDDGGGPALYAGGHFATAGGVAVSYVARWNGASWSALGIGMGPPFTGVHALAVFDDGAGPALYAGGEFTSAGGVAANHVAKWDGASWSPLGSGTDDEVDALAVFDDGGGPELYAGGDFTTAGGLPASRIAKWNGTSWSPLGSGTTGGVFLPFVHALTVFDDGGGPALFVGGRFLSAGGVAANYVAKWNGTSWSPLGIGMDFVVHALTAFDDGGGPALYAGGEFLTAGGVTAICTAKWDGSGWSALGSGMSDGAPTSVIAFAAFDDGGGPALYAGGDFTVSPAGDSYLAVWGCAITSVPGCAGNPATLSALAPGAPLGAPLPLRIDGASASSGAGLVYFGGPGFDAAGCGLIVPGFGELLIALAPAPYLMASGPLAGGACLLSFVVPANPAYTGVVAHMQGAAVDPAQPIELTNGLAVTLGP